MTYIDKFENVSQIRECAKYYIELLGLQDWKIRFIHNVPCDEENAGECESISAEKCACITIDNREHTNLWFKQPQELTLIHELLHCKMLMPAKDGLDGVVVEQYYHTLIDDWARSVFFARYGLTQKDLYFDEDRT